MKSPCHLRKDRIRGFVEVEVAEGQNAFVARPEKALIDLMALTVGSDDAAWIQEMRIEVSDAFDWARFDEFAEFCGGPKLKRGARAFREIARDRIAS